MSRVGEHYGARKICNFEIFRDAIVYFCVKADISALFDVFCFSSCLCAVLSANDFG